MTIYLRMRAMITDDTRMAAAVVVTAALEAAWTYLCM